MPRLGPAVELQCQIPVGEVTARQNEKIASCPWWPTVFPFPKAACSN